MTENSFKPIPMASSDGQQSPTHPPRVVITDTDTETHHCVKQWLNIVRRDGMYQLEVLHLPGYLTALPASTGKVIPVM